MEEDIEKAIDEFNRYAEKFDLNNEMIKRKYYHTFRVVDYAKTIAISEALNEHDYYLAFICALLHDIARFIQATEFGTYVDKLSFDHGDKGYEILLADDYISRYVSNEDDKQIVVNAVKNHNKYAIESGLSDRELYFTKLTRDADKLDIMDTQGNKISDNSFEMPDEVLCAIEEERAVKRDRIMQWSDLMVLISTLCFIYDINFIKSIEIIKDKEIVKRKIDVLEKNISADKFEFVREMIFRKIKDFDV